MAKYPKWRFSAPRRSANKIWFAGLIVASLVLLVLSRSDTGLTRIAHRLAADLTAPLLKLLSEPVARVRETTSYAGSYQYLVDEVSRLKAENREMRGLYAEVAKLQSDIARYERLLNATPENQSEAVTARVIADTSSPFVRTVLIDSGLNKDVIEGLAVIGADGVVGRTVSSGDRTSRVLLLSDLNSKVPVRVEPLGYRAILSGNNTETPTLEFLPLGARLQEGNRVVTSGHGGLFPVGLPVGIVEATPTGSFHIRLSAAPEYQQYVRVLKKPETPTEEVPGTASKDPPNTAALTTAESGSQ